MTAFLTALTAVWTILAALIGIYVTAHLIGIYRDRHRTLAADLARDPRVRRMPVSESCEWLATAAEIDGIEVRS